MFYRSPLEKEPAPGAEAFSGAELPLEKNLPLGQRPFLGHQIDHLAPEKEPAPGAEAFSGAESIHVSAQTNLCCCIPLD